MRRDVDLSVVCLGTGRGASMVYDGCCSAGYVFCADGHPLILFGAGYGVTRQCLRYFGVIPSNIFLFSGRSNMSAELPIILAVESRKGRQLCIVAEEAVMSCLKLRRLTELLSNINFSTPEIGVNGEKGGICTLVALEGFAGPVAANHTSMHHLPENSALALVAFRTPAAEASCGAVVLHHGVPVVALTGGGAYDAERHQEILRMAPAVILDARKRASSDHPSFTDIAEAVAGCSASPPPRVFIGQYGRPWEAPPVVHGGAALPVVEGAVVSLGSRTSLSDVAGARPSGASESPGASGAAELGRRPRRILIIDNESPDAPPTPMMVQHFRSIAQVKRRVSELLRMRPVGPLFCAETGRRLEDVSQFTHGMQVVATRVGGRPFDAPLGGTCGMRRGPVPRKGQQGTALEEAVASVEFDKYMRRAHRALRRHLGGEVTSAARPDRATGEPDTFVDSLSRWCGVVSSNPHRGARGIGCPARCLRHCCPWMLL